MIRTLTTEALFAAQQEALKLEWVTGNEVAPRELEPATAKFPGMALVGYLNTIHPNRVHVLGRTELDYLDRLSSIVRSEILDAILSRSETALIVIANNETPSELAEAATRHGIPLMQSGFDGPLVIETLNYYLSHALAPHIITHGVFMEVMGIGVMITGESGIGKSELALELLSRNHRLIADDAVEILRQGPDTLVGHCMNRELAEYLEVRGLGILNVRTMFGETAVRRRKQLHFTIRLERVDPADFSRIDRLQAEQTMRDILDIAIPEVTLYVAPGRNLAVLVEAATRAQILRMWGMNPAAEFMEKHQTLLKS